MLKKAYEERKNTIKGRLEEFKKVKSDDDIFSELCFCLLTPQSRAKNCWAAVLRMKENNLLHNGSENDILPLLNGVRFPTNKAKYIINVRENFPVVKEKLLSNIVTHANAYELREWLVENVKGFGYKEASHFLRNIGFSGLAILDRHILKNLARHGVINEIPKTLTKKKYLEIEECMKRFSSSSDIPLDELDLLFWSMETGEVFK
ncbi:MAG: N-glycosylase/DNA lyase [Candidatus Aenigmatarchaeota archaeon]